ncbi:MAG: FeoA family protein [Planctomycetaceae bacterium]
MLTLDQLNNGQRGIITELTGDDPVTARLFEMGLLAGEPVEMIGAAPFRDPLAIRVRGTRLAIRRRDARRIVIVATGTASAPLPASRADLAVSAAAQ